MVSHHVRPDGLLVTTGSGQVTYLELLEHLKSHVEDPDLEPGMRELVDLRNVTSIELTADEVRKLVEFEKRHLSVFDGARIAIVAPADLSFGLSRMYEIIADADDAELKVVRTEANALEWLGLTQ